MSYLPWPHLWRVKSLFCINVQYVERILLAPNDARWHAAFSVAWAVWNVRWMFLMCMSAAAGCDRSSSKYTYSVAQGIYIGKFTVTASELTAVLSDSNLSV